MPTGILTGIITGTRRIQAATATEMREMDAAIPATDVEVTAAAVMAEQINL